MTSAARSLAAKYRAALSRTGRGLALTLVVGLGMVGSGLTQATAQGIQNVRVPVFETPDIDIDIDTPDVETPGLPDTKGALVFHGNYCGPGSRGVGLPPVDALDEACMHHDACSPPVGKGVPSCGCNARLTREASLIARSPRISSDLRATATFVANGAKVLACR